MVRLIDADRAEKEFCETCLLERNKCGGECSFIRFLNWQPTIEPIKHGHWIVSEGGYKYRCSECGEISLSNYLCDPVPSKYCPECGAKMDKEVDDG